MPVSTQARQTFVAITCALISMNSIDTTADAQPAAAVASASVASASGSSVSGSSVSGSSASGSSVSGSSAAVDALTWALVRIDAATNDRGTGSLHDPLYVVVGNKPSAAGVHRCSLQAAAPNPCIAPGPAPRLPSHSMPQCLYCDATNLTQTWRVYTQKQLGAEALKRLNELYRQLGRRVPLAELAKLIGKHASAGKTSSSVQGKASSWALRDYRLAKTDTELHDAARNSLQQTIDACGLSITPDDLATEGGLDAAVKLSDAMLKTARGKWQKAFTAWVECLRGAAAKRRLNRASEAEAKACNAGPRGQGDVREHAEWKAVFDWQARRDAYDICLNANQSQDLVVAEYQVGPCLPGRTF